MKEENYKISKEYLKDLQKCLKQGVKGVTRYKIAHASYEKSNAHLIIKIVNKKERGRLVRLLIVN